MKTPIIRAARVDDLGAINDIFNAYVENSTVMFQDAPTTPEQRHDWFSVRHGAYPILVAESEEVIVGWASAGPYYKPRAARCTVESSIYVDRRHHRMGIGRALLTELIAQVAAMGYRSIVAEIHDQAPSLALHRSLGFRQVGRISEAGFKLGVWIDVILMQLKIADIDGTSA